MSVGMDEKNKSQKKTLKEFARLAYSREVQVHLRELAKDFKSWEGEEIDSIELSDKIYKYSITHARTLYSKYHDLDDDLVVSIALKDDILKESELPKDILDHVKNTSIPQFPDL